MAIKVQKVAEIAGNKVHHVESARLKVDDLAVILTNLPEATSPLDHPGWKMDLIIGVGPGSRQVEIDLPQFLDKADDLSKPKIFNFQGRTIVFFCNNLFLADRPHYTAEDSEELLLRMKKILLDESNELASLRATVSNLEAAISGRQNSYQREVIPEDVKMMVWARDQGACRNCRSRSRLQFDHIIPVAKGGSSVGENVQILCQSCNLRKSDKISF